MGNGDKFRESTEQYVRDALATFGQDPPPDIVQATVRKIMAAFPCLAGNKHPSSGTIKRTDQ